MIPLILIGIAAVTLFVYFSYSWFRTFFYKAFELKLCKELGYAFIFLAVAFCVMLYAFILSIVLVAGLVVLSIWPDFFLRAWEDVAIFTIAISTAALFVLSYCLNKAIRAG